MDTNIYLSNQIIKLITMEGEKAFMDKYATIIEDKTHLAELVYVNKVNI
jgi:hypothetical protein